MDLQKIPITDLIPQRSPFLMVDKLLSCDQIDAATSFTIRQDNILLDGTVFSEAGIIENMAQSCAARMGCINMMRNEAIKIGYIGDIKRCVIHGLPEQGDVLTTNVHVIEDVFHLTLAEITVTVKDRLIASAKMKIALVDSQE